MTNIAVSYQDFSKQLLDEMSREGLPPPVVQEGENVIHLIWEPGLTAEQLVVLQDLRDAYRTSLNLDRRDYATIRAQLPTLVAWRNREGPPTNAQVVATIDAIIKVLAAILRK